MKNFIRFIYALSVSSAMDIYRFFANHIVKVSAHALGWIAIVMLHFSSIPTLWAVIIGETDKLPNLDLMIFIWAALTTLFVKAILEKDRLYITTISLGFVAQTLMSGIILYK